MPHRLTVLTALCAALAVAAAAQATPTRGLHIGGKMTPLYWTWAVKASERVPMPDARFDITYGQPHYLVDERLMLLPRQSWGWTREELHGSFLHELGHAYDFANMTPGRRLEFRKTVGVRCKWWAKVCFTREWASGARVNVPPGEMFAETYAACALGLSQIDYQETDHTTYGWLPPKGSDDALCSLIRG